MMMVFTGDWPTQACSCPPPPPHKRLCACVSVCLFVYTVYGLDTTENVWIKDINKDGEISSCGGKYQGNWNSRRTAGKSKVWDAYLIIYIIYNISLISFKFVNFQCVFRSDLLAASEKNRTDPKTIAADRTTLPVRTAWLFNMGTERRRTAFVALLPPVRPRG